MIVAQIVNRSAISLNDSWCGSILMIDFPLDFRTSDLGTRFGLMLGCARLRTGITAVTLHAVPPANERAPHIRDALRLTASRGPRLAACRRGAGTVFIFEINLGEPNSPRRPLTAAVSPWKSPRGNRHAEIATWKSPRGNRHVEIATAASSGGVPENPTFKEFDP